MFGLNHDGNALWLQHLIDGVGDLRRHARLDLQSPRIGFHDARELGNSDDASVGHIGDPDAADDRRNMMLAMAFERDASETTISS